MAVLYSFQGGNDGAYPAGLMADAAGALYGTTYAGGSAGAGVVFKLTPPTWTATVVHGFQGGSDGAYPRAGLIADAAGAFYGTTCSGGGATGVAAVSTARGNPGGYGTVFRITQ
jgi:uncharacterized repeat protein (TIGR03803 family)